MTDDRSNFCNPLTRRRILWGAAGAALAASWSASATAFAGPKATKTTSKSKAGAAKASAKPTAKASAKPTASGPTAKATQTKQSAPTIAPLASTLTPEEKALGKAIADSVKHAIAAAAAEPTAATFAAGGFASLAQQYVKGLDSQPKLAARAAAKKLLGGSSAVRRKYFGGFASKKATAHSTKLHPVPSRVAKAATDVILSRKLTVAPAMPQTMTKIPKSYAKVGFFLNEIKCVEETDEIGADQIMCGGLAIAPTGEIVTIKRFKVDNDFDAGETKSYYPPGHKNFVAGDPYKGRHLASFALPPGNTEGSFPGSWTISLLMAEEDSGGFSEMLNELWAAIAEEVKIAIQVVGHVLGGIYGQLIGELAGWILGEVIGFLAQLFDNPDDYIDRVDGTLTLSSSHEEYFAALSGREIATPGHVWAGQRFTWKFNGDGGRYHAKAHWRVWS